MDNEQYRSPAEEEFILATVPSFRLPRPRGQRKRRRLVAFSAGAALVWAMQLFTAAAAGAAPLPSPDAKECLPPIPSYDDSGKQEYHCYEAVNQDLQPPEVLAHGIGANLYEDIPRPVHNGYSIAQITLTNDSVSKGPLTRDIDALEFGWAENPSFYGDWRPHLFLAVRQSVTGPFGTDVKVCVIMKDPAKDCPDLGGAWHPNPAAHFKLGDPVGPSGAPLYHVGYFEADHSWWVQYGGEWIGRITNDWWNDGFSSANHLNWQGEVAFYTDGNACVPMGNGDYGKDSTAAYIRGMFYEQKGHSGLTEAAAHRVATNATKYWTMGQEQRNGGGIKGFSYGGRGNCP